MFNQIEKDLIGKFQPTEQELAEARRILIEESASFGGYKNSWSPIPAAVRLRAYAIRLSQTRGNSYQVSHDVFIEQENTKRAGYAEAEYAKKLVPDSKYENVSLIEASETQVIQYIKTRYIPSGKKNLLLLGGAGAGKTYGAIAYVVSKRSNSQMLIRGRQLSELLGFSQDKAEKLKKIQSIRYLVIDELKVSGEGTVTPALISLVEDIVSDRHFYGKETLITSNATLSQFESTYGDRVMSRLREDGLIFETTDPDFRRQS